MYSSETFGRLFWVDDNLDFKSCPQYVDGTGDFDNEDYVSEWDDFTEVDVKLLLNIYKCELINKVQYAGSLSHKETPKVTDSDEAVIINLPEGTNLKKRPMQYEPVMNTYDEKLYKEIVKDSEFSYGKFNESNYPLHLQQH